MRLDFDAWKDGTPYDIALLDEMSDSERADIEAELSAKSSLDWRDVEALNRIGTKTALRRVQRATVEQRISRSVCLPMAPNSLALVYLEMSCVTVKVPKAPEPLAWTTRSGMRSRFWWASFSSSW